MRLLPAIVVLAAGIALAAPAMADFRLSARVGSGKSGLFVKIGKGGQFAAGARFGRHHRHRHRMHQRHGHHFGDGIAMFRREDNHSHEPEREIVVVPPPEPEPPAEAAPPEPPDPRGPWIQPARGTVPDRTYAVGEPLPPGLPHVTLDWRRYDLPEPPAGRIYARVGRDVLLITAAERVVESVVRPG